MLCCVVLWCGVVWRGVVWCGVAWCGVVWCGVVWCGAVWCGAIITHVVRFAWCAWCAWYVVCCGEVFEVCEACAVSVYSTVLLARPNYKNEYVFLSFFLRYLSSCGTLFGGREAASRHMRDAARLKGIEDHQAAETRSLRDQVGREERGGRPSNLFLPWVCCRGCGCRVCCSGVLSRVCCSICCSMCCSA